MIYLPPYSHLLTCSFSRPNSIHIFILQPMRSRADLRRRQQLDFEEDEDDHDAADVGTKVLYELCSMISHVLQIHISFPPAAFPSLFLGVSLALMLFGSLTFAIGFFLMPLTIGLLTLFYFVGFLYNLSQLGRTILWPCCSSPNVAGPAWRFL